MGRRGFNGEFAKKNGLPAHRYPSSKEEIQKAEDLLAADLANLTLDDQEKIIFDIHGLPILDNADDGPQKLDEKLMVVEKELQKLNVDRRAAYEQALYFKVNPEYASGRDFRLQFLRCNNYDPVLTADQIAQHFETKKKLFGNGEILGRPVLLSDLPDAAMKIMECGFLQALPSRDAAGRIVTFAASGFVNFDDMDNLKRAMWYFQQVFSTEEGSSTDGFVMIQYNMRPYGALLDWNISEELHNQTFDGAPNKMAAGHFCYDDAKFDRFITGAYVFSDEKYRHRWRIHFAKTKAELFFKLQTYGIPVEDFPVNDEGTLELGWHTQWLESQKARESQIAAKTFLIPRRFDVLFGRASDTRVHTGNLRAVHLVEMEFEEYEAATRQEKTDIAGRVVNKILESYGRFLKWEEGGWVEVDFHTARNKISHFFRRRRFTKKEPTPPPPPDGDDTSN